MKLAVIGAGVIGARHLDAAQETEGLEAVAVVEVNPQRASEFAAKYGIRAYVDYKQMLEEERPDIAVVALPHFLHKDVAIYCAEQGCHILLEKPMALNVAECDAIMAAAAKHNVQLLVGHTQHYHPENITAKKIIEGGELGSLVMINDMRHVHYYRADRPAWFFEKAKSGGGILTNLGAHSIDKIQWMTGSRLTKVKASLSFHGDRGDVEGSGVIFAETSIGVPATISQSGYPGVSRNETEFIFTNGMLKLETNKGLLISRGGVYEPVPVEPMEKPFVRQFKDLMQAILTGEEPDCSGTYSRTVISALESVYLSQATGTEQTVHHKQTHV
jgi:predicted dehydrogenase